MPLSAIRDQIKAIIEGADPTSAVHDYERWANTPDAIAALFQPDLGGPLRAWIITPQRLVDEPLTYRFVRVRYTFTLRFLYSLQDAAATEKAMLAVVETVRAAFRANDTLNGAALSTTLSGSAGAALPRVQTIALAGLLVHVAELELTAQEIVAA